MAALGATVSGSVGPARKALFALAGLALLTLAAAGLGSGNGAAPRTAPAPLSFVENAGQTDASVRYQAQGSGLYFTKKEMVLNGDGALALAFRNPNAGATITARAELPGKVNYIRGANPARWHTGLPTYGELRYANLWPGIDMVVRGSGGTLKYEFHVRPGARVGDIGLRWRGARRLALGASGAMLVHTPSGALRDARPVSYQMIDGKRVPVTSRYRLEGKNAYGFALGSGYDPRRPLVIDPAITYGTYLGGSDTDAGFEVAIDASGSAYVTGYTYSSGFPATAGAFDTSPNGGADVYVTKLDGAGALVYSTYLGGSGDEFGNGIAVDGAGNAYVAGNTYSADFPTTPGAFDTTASTSASGSSFVTKLNAAGAALSYSTYLDGGRAMEVAVDSAGSAHVAGSASVTLPTTAGAYDPTFNGNGDAFVTAFDATGSALTYSTYIGGTGSEGANAIALDPGGNAYLAGDTGSTDFPTTPGAYDSSGGGGPSFDNFITKLNASGSALVYSTYLGGGDTDFLNGIAVDPAGSAYVTGETFSADFPTTAGAYDTAIVAGTFDAYVTKLNALGTALAYSTYLGGNNSDLPSDIDVDSGGSAHVTGYTLSSDFPTTVGAQDRTLNGSDDTFVTRLNSAGSGLSYSTYLGGDGSDIGNGISVDTSGAVYVAGLTGSSDFPTTAGAHDTTYNGGVFDAYAAKLDLTGPPPSTPGCATFMHGYILADNGDRTRFNGRTRVSDSGEPSGSITYLDRGPSDRIVVRSTSIDAVVCDGRDASIFGSALVNDEEDSFQIDLHDGGGSKRDTFRTTLASGYDSGEQNLRSGQVQVR